MSEREQGDEISPRGATWQQIATIWADDPEWFLSEFSHFLGEAADETGDEEAKQLLLAAANNLREAAFNIYCLDK